MEAERPIRVGLLGAARIAPAALVEPARARDDVRLVSVAARDPARAAAFASEHGFEDASESYAALVAREDIDLIYIALPPDGHCRWTIAALEAQKAVLCEKPFALDAGEAQRMVAAAGHAGKPLIEAFHYRFHRLMHEALALVASGGIGEILGASATVEYPIPRRPGEPRWTPGLGGGAMMDLGCYGVHALRTLIGGEPELLSARAVRDDGVDAETEAQLRFPGGVEARLRASMVPQAPFTNVVLEGSLGRLDIGGFVLPQRAGRLALTRGGETRDIAIDGPSSYAAQLDHAVGVLRGGAPQLTGGADAVANMRVLDAIGAATA